jgi:hypothetical protein
MMIGKVVLSRLTMCAIYDVRDVASCIHVKKRTKKNANRGWIARPRIHLLFNWIRCRAGGKPQYPKERDWDFRVYNVFSSLIAVNICFDALSGKTSVVIDVFLHEYFQ